jgi:hypothetical protein
MSLSFSPIFKQLVYFPKEGISIKDFGSEWSKAKQFIQQGTRSAQARI